VEENPGPKDPKGRNTQTSQSITATQPLQDLGESTNPDHPPPGDTPQRHIPMEILPHTLPNLPPPENILPRLDPIWATLINPPPESPNNSGDTPMHDPTDALSLVMQLCAAGMDLGDVTLLGAELGVGPPTSTTPLMSAPGPPTPARPSTTSNRAPCQEMGQHPHIHAVPTQRPQRPKTATKRNAPLASPLLSSTEPRDLTDLDVDLAHADHPGEGAAIHLSEEGNETPLRIQVCRPVGIKVPTTTPTPTIYEVLRLRVATIRHIPAALQEHWSRTQAGILNAFCDNPSELLLWGLVAMPKLVLRVTRTRGKNAGAHQQDLIRSRLQEFEQGEWQDMWTTLKSESASPEGPETRSAKRARVDVHATNSAAVRRAQKCLAEGSPGKALQQLTSPGLHDTRDPVVWEKLKQLHPRGPPLSLELLPADIKLDLGDQDVHSFWEPLVKDAIASFPRSSAPGPSGLRASHLQDALRRPGRGAPLVSAIARFCHMWAHGIIPEEMLLSSAVRT
jgi:hypothetical protein